MNEMATGVRTKRRMGGIPPLAPDLVIDGPVAMVRAERAAAPSAAAPVPAQVQPAGHAPQDAAVPEPTAVPATPAVQPVQDSAHRRRLGGASTVPLLLPQPQVPATQQAQTSEPIPQAPDAAMAQTGTAQTSAEVQAQPAPAIAAPKGRRMPGASNVPLLVAAGQPQSPARHQVPEPVQDRPAVSSPAATERPDAERVPAQSAPAQSAPVKDPAAVAQQTSLAPAPPAAAKAAPPAKKLPSKYAKLAWQVGAVLAVCVVAVLLAQWARGTAAVQGFIDTYPGHASQPASTPEGIPAWLGWQHFLNMFFMVLIVRSGLQVRLQSKPPGYWTAKKRSFFSPGSQSPKKISLTQWFHQLLDVAWVLNGVLFVIALFATGFWARIVPTSWDVFPNMLSAGIQYASLDWPDENGWIHYNALQVMAYFITVFIAAPLAVISGVRMSTWWPSGSGKLSKFYPVEAARAIHIPVMVYFVGFVAVHVFLVFFTGARRNLNHMFTSRDVADFWGLVIFAVSVLAIAAAWFLSSPMFIRPLAGAMGKVSKN